ncbi:unnamed protein product [Tuber aestivum]|uniref:Isopenicillin N synthase-like Fe(2+) 2OG dioxygenase domain-containing protein n=1 Tax=Tuber aestivum TaxID=59557 RepID=A0A292PVI6_9PEZI|nr:unnamed protein product [Tuber aestivum]
MIYQKANPVLVRLDDLESGNVDLKSLEEAFGPESLGIIFVGGLPEKFVGLRRRLLSFASHLGNLSRAELEALECPEAKYLYPIATFLSRNFDTDRSGERSCAKEKLSSDKVDTLKGSYYANCAFHKDPELANATGNYPDLPEYTKSNIWPREGLLVGFKETFKEFCAMVIDIASLVARLLRISIALEHIPGYQEGYLEHVVKTSTTTKARLLHYFPPPSLEAGSVEAEEDLDNWCGAHIDFSCLTGLTSAMYVDEGSLTLDISQGVDLPELESVPDPDSGLYVKDRKGGVVKVGIPRDCLAFQTGAALEAITEGKLKAVPHFVRGCRASKAAGVSRNTIAVFTQPNLWEKIDKDRDFATFAREIVAKITEG